MTRLIPPHRGLRSQTAVCLIVTIALLIPTVAFADFCSGKASGYWCDGDKLVLCKSGSVSSSTTCTAGCQSMSAGTDDKCKSGGFCSGKASGYWCDGSKLILCKSGAVSSSKTCNDGCQPMPAGTDDKCKTATPTGPCTGKANGYWCDGNKLLLCKSGAISSSQTCNDGCQSMPAGTDDKCKTATPTGPCTGKANGYWCDGSKLLLCKSGAVSSSKTCSDGCQPMPAGTDDKCKTATPTGPCTGKANGYWCDGNKLLLCTSGAIASTKTCNDGCQPMPAGTDDTCKTATPTGSCTGKANGYWCDGSNLLLCNSGAVSSSKACSNGCQPMPAGTDDACKGGASTGGLSLCQPFKPAKSVTCAFGCYSGHMGSDYAAAEGTPVYAPMSGEAVLVRKSIPGQTCSLSFGNYVKIANGSWSVILAHMGQDIPIQQGQMVKAGQLVGKVSNTGYTMTLKGGKWVCMQGGGHHLHLELRQNGTPVNAQSTSGVSWSTTCSDTAPASGPCTGKSDGAWCSGAALLTCKSGAVAKNEGCPAGCQSEAAGTADHCKSAATGFCAGKADGAWCDGAALRTCGGGSIKASVSCAAGCQSMPAGVSDSCKPATTWCTGKVDGPWCKGSSRVTCGGGGVVKQQVCANGCTGAGGAASCGTPGAESFCTKKADGAWCDQGVLRLCGGGVSQGTSTCEFGCVDNGGQSTCKSKPVATDFCAGKNDGAWCDAAVLRQCLAGATTSASTCAQGCTGGDTQASCASVGGGDFCAGKSDATLCDGGKAVSCKSGVSVSTISCAFGCDPGGKGQQAACLAASAKVCATLGDGNGCHGDLLVACLGGKVVAQAMCGSGCVAGAGGASCKAGDGFCGNKVAGVWCNGASLVTCVDGVATQQVPCGSGCTATPGNAPDVCSAGSDFCVGKVDGPSCDSAYAVSCVAGVETGRTLCGFGCLGINGQGSCGEVSAGVCGAGEDGPRCSGASLLTCLAGEVVTHQYCANGCWQDPAVGPTCVTAGSGVPGQLSVGKIGACHAVLGSRTLPMTALTQRPHDVQLGTCPDRTIAKDGALITVLSGLYAALGLPRTVLGVVGNTPPLENVWRLENTGYQACGGKQVGVCCVRWSQQPKGLAFTWFDGGSCLSEDAATSLAGALVSGTPVVVGVHGPKKPSASHWMLVYGVNNGVLQVADPAGGTLTTLALAKGGPYVADVLVTPRLGANGPVLNVAGQPLSDVDLAGGIVADPETITPADGWLDAGVGGSAQASPATGCGAGGHGPALPALFLLLLVAIALYSRRLRG